MQFRLAVFSIFSLTVKVWRTETAAHFLVHVWLYKLGTHFGFSAQD